MSVIKLNNVFGDYQAIISCYIDLLYEQSVNFYKLKYQGQNKTGTLELDKQKIKNAVGYVADYLYYYYKFYNDDFQRIFLLLIEKLNYVTVLASDDRGLYGKFEESELAVYINPQLESSATLNSDERMRLYINHELGHIINNQWMSAVFTYLNNNDLDINKQLVYDGFSLLDEAITQNMAEEITYYYAKKQRPRKISCKKITKEWQLFDGKTYLTNYDFYGELQGPASNFAKTLRGIVSSVGNNDDRALMELCKRALKSDFFLNVVVEYYNDGQMDKFYTLFEKLGVIKKASYATFGMDNVKYINSSRSALETVDKLCSQLYEVRPTVKRK